MQPAKTKAKRKGWNDMADGLAGPRPGAAVAEDLRRRAVAAVVERGMSIREAGLKFGVAATSVFRWVRRFRARGHVRADKPAGRASRIEPHRERIFRLVEERPELSGRALRAVLAGEGLVFSEATVQRFLKRHRLQRKQRRARRR